MNQFLTEEKIRIIIEGMRGEETVAALCRKEDISQALYYRWSKDFMRAGKKRIMGDTMRDLKSLNIFNMKILKIYFLLLWICFGSFMLYSQQPIIPPDINYYEVYDSAMVYYGDTLNIDTLEAGPYTQFNRNCYFLYPRLAPSGNMNNLNESINDYNCSWMQTQSNYNPNWQFKGPRGNIFPSQYVVDNLMSHTGNGQIHRIAFDPEYNISNQVVYAASAFGGLFKSTTVPIYWQPYLSDHQMPNVAVADIDCVRYLDANENEQKVLFVAGGDGDYGEVNNINGNTTININHSYGDIGPTQTSGLYRELNDNGILQNINGTGVNSICVLFAGGGTIRKILVNPENPNIVFLASTIGIIRSENAMESNPEEVEWEIVYTGESGATENEDAEMRGLVFVPNTNYNGIIASGRSIYKSDNGGTDWADITNPNEPDGIDIANLEAGLYLEDFRINVAITTEPNDYAGLLYAYIVNHKHFGWIYAYKLSEEKWYKIHEFTSISPNKTAHYRWLGIAINPNNPYNIYFTTERIRGNNPSIANFTDLLNGGDNQFGYKSPYGDGSKHADTHEIIFEPNNLSDPLLFYGDHGGVGGKDISITGTGGCIKLYNGLEVATIYQFDHSLFNSYEIGIGMQDNSVATYQGSTNLWQQEAGQDGYRIIWNGILDFLFFRLNYESSIYRSDNYFQSSTGENSKRPIDLQTNQQTTTNHLVGKFLPDSDQWYVLLGELYERIQQSGSTASDVWEIRSDVGKSIPQFGDRRLHDFEISESNSDYIYLIREFKRWSGSGPNDDYFPALLISNTGGCKNGIPDYNSLTPCFYPVDLSQINIPGMSSLEDVLPNITDIEINPNDPSIIYLSFSGYTPELKVLKARIDEISAGDFVLVPIDYMNSDQLQNLPVNKLILQRGKEETLYIGTDAGVYVKDGPNASWEKYGEFPNVRVTDMKVHYCSGKLRVATFGRGLWEGELLPSDPHHSYERKIEENTTWDEDRPLLKNLRIKSGFSLTIDGSTLFIPSNGKITVEKGARLILINGAKITNNCDRMWYGIEVEGDPDINQNWPYYEDHGFVSINDATIENSKYGIKLIDGGVLSSTNGNFINNGISLEFYPYKNLNSTNGQEYRNNSAIYGSTFEVNDNYLGEVENVAQIRMQNVYGIELRVNDFINSRTVNTGEERGSAILSLDAGFHVTGTIDLMSGETLVPSTFDGWQFAINAKSLVSLNTFEVEHSEFTNNLVGVFSEVVDMFSVNNCTFHVGGFSLSSNQLPLNTHFGIISDMGHGYEISFNEFSGIGSGIGGGGFNNTTTGVLIKDSNLNEEESTDVVDGNSYTSLDYANLSNGVNKGNTALKGLQYECNEQVTNFNDIIIPESNIPNHGIRETQGSASDPAGNTFSQDFTILDYHLYNGAYKIGNGINYFYYNQDPTQEPLENYFFGVNRIGSNDDPTCKLNNQPNYPPDDDGCCTGLAQAENNYLSALGNLHLPSATTEEIANVANLRTEYFRKLDYGIGYKTKDTVRSVLAIDSLISKMDTTVISDAKLAVDFYIKDSLSVDQKLNSGLDYSEKENLYNILLTEINDPVLSLDSNQLIAILNLSDSIDNRASLRAANLLEYYYGDEIYTHVYFSHTEEDSIGNRSSEEVYKMKILPNPAMDQVILILPEEQKGSVIEIFLNNGSRIYTNKGIKTEMLNIDVSTWLSGVYFVHFKNKEGQSEVQKLLIQK